MDTKLTLSRVWNWLPAFRAVAETEHLPTAARRLHVSTSAISRTLKLLEEHLELQLFNRSGRSLVLNAEGEKLLGAITRAMSEMDIGLNAVSQDPFTGPLRVSAIGLFTNHFVIPAMLSMVEEHPTIVPMLDNRGTEEANSRLISGHVDVAFYYEALTQAGLHIVRLGETSASVYCGEEHPLFCESEVSLEMLLEHPFSVPALGDTGQVLDGWPITYRRKIGMQIALLTSNLKVCLSGRFVTVLPDVTALASQKAGLLRRFEFDLVPPISLFAARRSTDSLHAPSSALIERVKDKIVGLNAEIEALKT